MTTPRLYTLMQESWTELETLVVTNLKPAEEGPYDEEEEMWDLVEVAEDAEWFREQEERDAKKKREEEGEEEGESMAAAKAEELKVAVEKIDGTDGDKPKRAGLKTLALLGFNVTGSEMDLILQDVRRSLSLRRALADSCRVQSAQTLETLQLARPGYLYSRFELASTLLSFGHKLTTLDLTLPAAWDPVPKLTAGIPGPAFPPRPKDYIVGKPKSEHLRKIATYTYPLDACMSYLPNLKKLRFEGPYASTSIFSFLPPTLTQ